MKLLLIIISLVGFLYAQNVEIIADKFYADEKKQLTEFSGHVVITKGKDRLKANNLIITFDKQRKPLKYQASEDTTIDIIMQDKSYFGRAKTMVYDPIKDQYTLLGDAFLHEKVSNKKVYGDKIFVNQASGRYEVHGDGKSPVKFIFKVEERK